MALLFNSEIPQDWASNPEWVRKLFAILIFIASGSWLFSQNLVPNPSFEEFGDCPVDLNLYYNSQFVNNWTCPNKSTPDYFNACSRFNVGVPVNVMGNMFAYEGAGYIGLILLEKPDHQNYNKRKPYNYREYIQCMLIEPLVKDSLYLIKYAYCIAPFSKFIICRPELYISNNPIKSNSFSAIKLPVAIEADTLSMSNNAGEWQSVSKIVKATGGEQFITIGNFLNDSQTTYRLNDLADVPSTQVKRILIDGYAYYYIDNVEVVLVNSKSVIQD